MISHKNKDKAIKMYIHMEEEEINIVFIQPSIKIFLKCVTVISAPLENIFIC